MSTFDPHFDINTWGGDPRQAAGTAAGNPSRPRRTRPAGRRVGFRRRNRKIPYTISLNLTAMIDTVFNLLFLFIIISRFGPNEGMLPARLPTRAGQPAAGVSAEVPRVPLRISLVPFASDPAGCRAKIDRFCEQPIALKELGAVLTGIQRKNIGFDAQTPVHLLAGEDVIWDHVVNAYNAAMTARFGKIYFAGSPTK